MSNTVNNVYFTVTFSNQSIADSKFIHWITSADDQQNVNNGNTWNISGHVEGFSLGGRINL